MIKQSIFNSSAQFLLKCTKSYLNNDKKIIFNAINEIKDLQKKIKEIDSEVSLLETRVTKFPYNVPLLKSIIYPAKKIKNIKDKKKNLIIQTQKIIKKTNAIKSRYTTTKAGIKKLVQQVNSISSSYQSLDKDNQIAIRTFVNKVEYLKRSKRQKFGIDDYLDVVHMLDNIVVVNSSAKSQVEKRTDCENDLSRFNIYLPIPIDLRHEAKRLGARYDPKAGRGSRMFINLETDKNIMPRLQHLLPTAYRTEREEYSFPPIRHNAAKHNLWSLFSTETWNHIRSMNYSHCGNRCHICGQQGGQLIEQIFPDNQHKKGSVESHEVWKWEVLDIETGIGVQRLNQILTVCVDCHMMFHEDFAIGEAKTQAVADKVTKFLRSRQAMVNGVDPITLQAQMDSEKARAEMHNGIDNWVLDLSHLAEQDYMNARLPVFNENNMAGVSPEIIAGIEFETTSGHKFPARDAAEIYAQLISEFENSHAHLQGISNL